MKSSSRILLRLAVAVGMLGVLASCDYAAPYVAREASVSDETMACVQEAIRTSSSWTVLESLDHGDGPLHQPEGTFYLEVPSEESVFTPRVEFDDRGHRFVVRAYVPDDLAAWQTNRAEAREKLRFVYEEVRLACPGLVPFAEAREDAQAPPDRAKTARFLRFLFFGTVTAILLGLLALYGAMRVVKPPVRPDDQDGRMVWHRR